MNEAEDRLRESISRRIAVILACEDPSLVDSSLSRMIHIAALSYSARYLRSILAERSANLLEERALELDLEGLDLEDEEGYVGGRTMIGLGVRSVPSPRHSF